MPSFLSSSVDKEVRRRPLQDLLLAEPELSELGRQVEIRIYVTDMFLCLPIFFIFNLVCVCNLSVCMLHESSSAIFIFQKWRVGPVLHLQSV